MVEAGDQRLEDARVLVELGELLQAEAEVATILEEEPDDLEALRLFAKIKHMRFQLYVARHPNEARAVCRRVTARHRERDAEVYKLSVLAEAWISELMGDLEAACAILERLGRERGFEADLDRVTLLVGVYELIGTREKLEAAVNICRFLERSVDPRFVGGRLAHLLRRLGRGEEAARYEARQPLA